MCIFQHAATEVLVKKISKALIDTGREGIILAGGVAANKLLREKFLPPAILKY